MKREWECAKCDQLATETLKLIGEYYTQLCLEHRNQWGEYISAHPTHGEYHKVKARYDTAVFSGNADEAEKRAVEFQEIKRQLNEIARAWVNKKGEEE